MSVSRDSRLWCPALHSKRKNSTGGKDVGLPLMQDSRFERVTLFLVFDEDFPFEPEESSGEANLERVGGQDDGATELQCTDRPLGRALKRRPTIACAGGSLCVQAPSGPCAVRPGHAVMRGRSLSPRG